MVQAHQIAAANQRARVHNSLDFIDFIASIIDVSPFERLAFESLLTKREFAKGDIIHASELIHQDIYFIRNGSARGFYIDEKGRDITWHFYFNRPQAHPSNLYVIDYRSYVTDQPSLLSFEALEPCTPYGISKSELQKLYHIHAKWLRLHLKVVDIAYAFLHEKYFIQLTQSAYKRYKHLLETMPLIFDIAPQYHIASYISVSPQHLSRLKNVSMNKC